MYSEFSNGFFNVCAVLWYFYIVIMFAQVDTLSNFMHFENNVYTTIIIKVSTFKKKYRLQTLSVCLYIGNKKIVTKMYRPTAKVVRPISNGCMVRYSRYPNVCVFNNYTKTIVIVERKHEIIDWSIFRRWLYLVVAEYGYLRIFSANKSEKENNRHTVNGRTDGILTPPLPIFDGKTYGRLI